MSTSQKHSSFVNLSVLAAFVFALVLSVLPGPQAGLARAETRPAPIQQEVSPAAVDAGCTTLQPDEAASYDAWINQDNVTDNKNDSELRVKTESGKLNRSLIRFDLTSAVPTNAKVTSATLSLWVKDVKDGNATVSAHQLLDYWTEDQVTWRYQDKATTEEWTTQGGDYNAAVLDSEAFTDGVKDYFATFNVSTAAQSWAANPAANYGVILESPVTSPKSEIKFKSSADGTASQRPKLDVCWSVGVGVAPDNLAQGTAGQAKVYGHTVTVTDFTNEAVGLTAVSNQGWTVNIYKDVNGNGVKDAGDTAITQTPAMGPNGSYKILVEVMVPANAANGTKDITTVTATGLGQGTVDTAKNTTLVGFPPVADPVLDGRRDLAYTQSLDSNTQDYCDASGNVLARLMSLYDAASPDYVWVILEMDLAHADNSYGTNAHPSWSGGHSLGNLLGSDKGQVILKDGNGTVIFNVTADYVEDGLSTSSGYGSAGVTAGEGSIAVGNASQVAVETSIGYSLNRFCASSGSCTVSGVNLFQNSPPVNADYTPVNSFFADWQYPYLYEFRFDRAAFGSAGFGNATINNVHISPNKTGSNEIPVTPCNGSIGDRVWQDYDGDKVQDSNEPGLNGVMVNLYRDTGNGTFEPATDLAINTRFTAGDGDYDFTGLGPGTYFVDVVESTIPADYVLTTANEPMKVILAKGQDFNDADFGYRTVPNLAISKTLISGDPAVVGSQIEFSIRITNTGNVPIDILPVVDYYDPAYLQFVSATPTHSSVSGGVIRWNDLTVSGGNLAVGASTTITVRFTALQKTAAPIVRLRDAIDAEPVVDGLLENNYTFVGRSDPAGNAPGNLYKYTGASMCYYAFVVDRAYNDNVYAQNDDPYLLLDGWDGHTYGNLDGSDKAIFTVSGSNGTYADLEMDYITKNGGAYTVDFFDAPINAAKTSLHYNLNSSGWNGNGPSPQYVNGNVEYHSPPYNWNDTLGQYWEWHMIYEFSIPKSSVGTDCGTVTLAGAHNSPSKDDDNLGLIGDYIWADLDGQGDQDETAAGIPGVRVNLYKNNVLVRTTETEPGSSGFYIFSNLEAGTYVVNVDESTLPVGYTLTTANEPKTVNLAAGQDYRNADFGYVPGQGSIGDRVYYDINGDGGLDNDGEPGINNVTVNLFQGSCPGSGQPFKSQITSGNGDYLFTTLPAGSYCVNVDDSTLPANYSLTTAPEPRPVVLGLDQHYLLADFGYRVQQTDKSCDVATVFGAKDQYGTSPADKSDFACVEIKELDFGDLPDPSGGTGAGNYQTLLAENGPRHIVTTLKMGATIDGEPDGQPNATATGDGADEDGVTIPALVVGQTATVVVNSSATAKLNAFFDWNNDGDFDDSGEAIAQLSVVAGNNNLSVPVPAGAVTGVNIGARFRLSTAGGLTALGAAPDGEVEDYLVKVDAPGIAIEKTTNGASADFPDGTDVQKIAPGATVTWQYLVTNNGTTNIARSNIAVSDNVVGNLMVAGVAQTLASPYTGVTLVSGAAIADNVLGPGESFLLQVTRPAEALNPIDPNASGSDQYVVGCKDSVTNPNGRTTYKNTATVTVPGATASDDSHYCNPPDLGSIGNYVWVDENSDGYQDAGEPGIPNVRIWLKNSTGTIIAKTWTDAEGGYLFTKLPGATYFADVDETTLPPGMSQTPYKLPNADLGNQDHSGNGYQIVLPTGIENLTADFGYNDNPTACVDGDPSCPDPTATIGDRVWVDVNGNGQQDPAEVGIPGVVVTLRFDPDGDGIYTPAYNTTTDSNGNYLFDGLPPGAYIVTVTPPVGYTQTGDPDQWGVACTTCDNQTTTPVVLAPGDVFLNADFGYQPPAAQNNSIGDTVWFDANANQVGPAGTPGGTDTTEKGIPNVTVALIKDVNSDGIWDPDGADNVARTADDEAILAVDTTDSTGKYLFSGLPDGSYLVWVNDTDNVLADKRPTYDSNGGAAPTSNSAPTDVASSTVLGLSSVVNLGVGSSTPVSNLNQDFGYTAPGQDPGEGLIGDRVWLDSANLGVQDASEPGIEGVRVELRDNSNVVLGVTYTDENGNYYFGGLSAGTYKVVVTPPLGMVQTYDADSGTGPFTTSPHQSTVTIAAGGINLLQDFGYRGTGTVGDLVWRDLNADGNVDAGETGIPGVTLDLYWDLNGNEKIDAGEPRLGTATTNGSGNYLFTGLPTDDGGGNAQFVVDVTDVAGLLNGYIHSLGTAGLNDNSQTDPYAVMLTPGASTYLAADFGYYIRPGALGNFVWHDTNYNGVQDVGEPGINGVTVTLTAKYFGGVTYTFATVTGDDPSTGGVEKGWYSFGNLLLDEDHASSKTGTPTATQPVYTISVATPPSGLIPTASDYGGNDLIDSDNPAGVDGLATQGQVVVTQNANPNAESNPIASYDFGYVTPPPYTISKHLNTVEPVRNGEPISFTIRITNTSTVALSTIPLTDTYDIGYLTYVAGSTPVTEDQINDGLLNWGDLTQAGVKGFNADLLPGQSFSVIVNFVGRADTTSLPAQSPCTETGKTCNVATAWGVKYDPDGSGGVPEQGPLPSKSAWDDVQILVPTAVDLIHQVLTYDSGEAILGWETVNEVDITGFHLYRSTQNEERIRINTQMVPSQVPGQSRGAVYIYVDGGVEAGRRYDYYLEAVTLSGASQESYLGMLLTGPRLFIPSVMR